MTASNQKSKYPDSEERRLNLEEARLEAEKEIRAADQAVRKIEEEDKRRQATFDRRYKLLELKERRSDRELKLREIELGQGRGIRFTAAQATVTGAVLTVLGAIIGAVIQGFVTRDVEAGKNQALIVIEDRKARANIDLEKEKFGFSKEQETQKEQHELILKMISVGNVQQARTNLEFLAETGLVRDKGLADRILTVKATPVLPPSVPQATPIDESDRFELQVCNRTSEAASMAVVAKRMPNMKSFDDEGWWQIPSGACTLIGKFSKSSSLYWTAKSSKATFGAGRKSFCMPAEKVSRPHVEGACNKGEELLRFSEVLPVTALHTHWIFYLDPSCKNG
jgi:uncharacterized membrane protein